MWWILSWHHDTQLSRLGSSQIGIILILAVLAGKVRLKCQLHREQIFITISERIRVSRVFLCTCSESSHLWLPVTHNVNLSYHLIYHLLLSSPIILPNSDLPFPIIFWNPSFHPNKPSFIFIPFKEYCPHVHVWAESHSPSSELLLPLPPQA